MEQFKEFIALSKYARWLPDKKRRETWEETIDRYVDFFCERSEALVTAEDYNVWKHIREAILNREVMPSMRAMMTAGKALDRDNIAGFNCCGIAINHPRTFDEIFYILMNGAGVGFSVERQYTNQLSEVSEDFYESETIIKVRDSKIGWASALRELIGLLYNGRVPTWDTTKVRPAGARLKTFGGRASGPLPLEKLFKYTVNLFKHAKGRKLNSLECHDLVCMIADTVIVGSVRRAACISLSNLSDHRLARAKTGSWWLENPQRALANNSVAYSEKPDLDSFTKEMRSMHKSRAGERGIVNLEALKSKAGLTGRNDNYSGEYLLNPCGEALLRTTGQCCNLSEVVVREGDTLDDLKRKVRLATILGTLQSTLTNFRYLRSVWKRNADEERLLGVSLTGIMDHSVMSGKEDTWEDEYGNPTMELFDPRWNGKEMMGVSNLEDVLTELKQVSIDTNIEWAKKLGINPSKQITLVKPSGTVSQLVDSASGIHPRMFPFYLRNIRQDIKDPISTLMVAQGVPHLIQDGKYIFKFPIKAPDGAITSNDTTALGQLELWKIYRNHWCDGNPSQTIYYSDDEYFDMCGWVWKNWDIIGGLAFLPKCDTIYENPPYEECSEDVYQKALLAFPTLDWSKLGEFELQDETTSSQAMACTGGACEL